MHPSELANFNAVQYLELYQDIMLHGMNRSPRGQKTKELRNWQLDLSLYDNPCSSFRARKFNLQYAKKELLWYLQADKKASWIEQYATAWKKLRQPSGIYHSNYGQYLFVPQSDGIGGQMGHTQFDYCVTELMRDPDSRRASMVLLQPKHLYHGNSDVVCTYAINFSIVENALDMTVMMRSNDAIWGLTNDAFCFWYIGRMMYALLVDHYPNLLLGTYTHIATSLHIYERHFEMADQIIKEGLDGYEPTEVVIPDSNEVRAILQSAGREGRDFLAWLTA